MKLDKQTLNEIDKIIYTEEPLVINKRLAKLIGHSKAIILQELRYRINSPEVVIKNGVKYCVISFTELAEATAFSDRQVKSIVKELESIGLIDVCNYAENKMLRTNWYSINLESLQIHDSEVSSQSIVKSFHTMYNKITPINTINTMDNRNTMELINRITGTGLSEKFEEPVSNETEISSVIPEGNLPVVNNSSISSEPIQSVKRKVKKDINSTANFFDIPTEPELVVPNTLILTEKQKDIMNRRNKKNELLKIKNVKPKENINSLSDRIYSAVSLKLITPVKELYKSDEDFDWSNAAKLLRKTVRTDDRYTEFKIIIDQITDSEELNLLYHIIKESKILDSIKKDIIKKHENGEINNTTTLSDRYFYSFLFKEIPYQTHLNKIYKIYRLKLNDVIVQLEKEDVNNKLNNNGYKSQIGR